ncbi:MAG: hydrogenase maturation protease [Deltaproteobacteria bacterium]|nr:hydrogenase maturation protease [Deltaproteobacteria bacterium]
MKTLLIGMGNPILSDDAVGVRLARDIGRGLVGVPGLSVMEECSVGGLNILDIVQGYDQLIVLDSIRTTGGTPGDWHRFTGIELRETMNLNNIHDVNFATALELGRRMGMKVPAEDKIHIFAVEVHDISTFSEKMSPPLERAYAEFSQGILREIEGILGDQGAWDVDST